MRDSKSKKEIVLINSVFTAFLSNAQLPEQIGRYFHLSRQIQLQKIYEFTSDLINITDLSFSILSFLPLLKLRNRDEHDETRGMPQEGYTGMNKCQWLKELEKLGPRKGVISQSVKDVVQSLVDDDLVSKDKIGTSVYFWSLPSCAGNQVKQSPTARLNHILNNLDHLLVEQCQSLKKGREDSDAREEALSELKAIEQKYNDLKEEMVKYADNDPATFEAMKEAIRVAIEASNRWTDNIFTLRQWCANNFPQAKEQLEHLYNEVGITEDFDYLELPALTPVNQVEE
ncbi:hypothetical protein E3N88_06069 [Mikania micrantha]|uniref:Meiotic nuclear division protein 1 homolog n=1 Tax=Mikania micrantha TaxID=192012 RepID=A0A5N6PMR7_9ASTR|nr:hypothetical protein E3N88_06069 [Mikania micrantha]